MTDLPALVEALGVAGVLAAGLFFVLRHLSTSHKQQQEYIQKVHAEHRAEMATVHDKYQTAMEETRDEFRADLKSITTTFSEQMDKLAGAFEYLRLDVNEIKVRLRLDRPDTHSEYDRPPNS